MSMYKKFLLKKHFWPQGNKKKNNQTCYVKHEVNSGGVYAYIQQKGVKIVAKNQTRFFNNFNDLDEYLDKLSIDMRDGTEEFIKILNRASNTKTLRKFSF